MPLGAVRRRAQLDLVRERARGAAPRARDDRRSGRRPASRRSATPQRELQLGCRSTPRRGAGRDAPAHAVAAVARNAPPPAVVLYARASALAPSLVPHSRADARDCSSRRRREELGADVPQHARGRGARRSRRRAARRRGERRSSRASSRACRSSRSRRCARPRRRRSRSAPRSSSRTCSSMASTTTVAARPRAAPRRSRRASPTRCTIRRAALALTTPLQHTAWRYIVALGRAPRAHAAARGRARRHARAPEPHVRRRRRAEPEARDRPRAPDRGRGAGEESRLRRARRRRGARLRVARRTCRARRSASSARKPTSLARLRAVDLVERFTQRARTESRVDATGRWREAAAGDAARIVDR